MFDPQVQMVLAVAGGISIKWLFEKLLNFAGNARKKDEVDATVLRMLQHDASKEAFERHVIETLAKMTILLDELTRRIER